MGPYIDRCVPFQIMSNQLNVPQVDSNQVVEASRMINGNMMHLSSILSLLAKVLNTYVNKGIYHITISLWGVVCTLRRENVLFNTFNLTKCGKSKVV